MDPVCPHPGHCVTDVPAEILEKVRTAVVKGASWSGNTSWFKVRVELGGSVVTMKSCGWDFFSPQGFLVLLGVGRDDAWPKVEFLSSCLENDRCRKVLDVLREDVLRLVSGIKEATQAFSYEEPARRSKRGQLMADRRRQKETRSAERKAAAAIQNALQAGVSRDTISQILDQELVKHTLSL